jgi:hypothetical protein
MIASHERPSIKVYQKDGTGRDGYISANNGGFGNYPTPINQVNYGTGPLNTFKNLLRVY